MESKTQPIPDDVTEGTLQDLRERVSGMIREFVDFDRYGTSRTLIEIAFALLSDESGLAGISHADRVLHRLVDDCVAANTTKLIVAIHARDR